MLDGLKNLAALGSLARDLPRIRQKMEDVKQRLDEVFAIGESGGGAVRVTATASLRVVSIHTDRPLLTEVLGPVESDNAVMAAELIAEAVNDALRRARELAERELASAAQELGLPLPPSGLAGLIG